jgi:hypothetical protein
MQCDNYSLTDTGAAAFDCIIDKRHNEELQVLIRDRYLGADVRKGIDNWIYCSRPK